jgi:hypothetical protein
MDCSMCKSSLILKLERMDTVEATYPWEIVDTDIMGPLLLFTNNNTHIIVFTDLFTKYAEIFAIAKTDTKTKLRYMLEKLFVDMEHLQSFF